MTDQDERDLEARSDKSIDIDSGLPFMMVREAIVDFFGKQLGATGIAVYLCLKMYANSKTQACWVATKTISDAIGLGESTVRRDLKNMESLGLISRQRRFNNSTVYTILRLDSLVPAGYRTLPNSIHSERMLPNSDHSLLDSAHSLPDDNLKRLKERDLSKETDTTPSPKGSGGVDPRFTLFHREYFRLYMEKNNCPRAEVPWGPKESAILNRLLRSHPGWSEKFLATCLTNRFRSDVNKAEGFALWYRRLESYRNGPLNEYGKPLKVADEKELEVWKPNA